VGDPTDRHVAVVFKDVSEQRKTEAALRDSETRANDLLRYAPTGIYQIAFDPPRFLEVNDAMCMMSGYSRQELLSMDPLDLLDDESKALFMERMRRSLAGDAPVGEVEYRVRRKDGRRIFVVLNVRFTHDSDGRPEGAFVVGHDVTERRRDEEALRRSEQRFALLSHANSLLLSASEPESLIQTIAAGVMDLLGCDVFFNYVRDAESGRLHLNAHGGVDAEMAKAVEWLDPGTAICGCVLQESSPIVSEDVQHNGDPRAALVRSMGVQAYACHPLLVGEETVGTLSFGSKSRISFGEDDLAVMRTVASGVSVALERKRAEDALRESDSRFRGVLETALDAAYRRDLVKDAYDYMSPVVESITGFTADEFSHLPMQEVLERIHPEDRSAVEDAIAVSERTGRLISEYRFRAKNGHYVWLADYSTVVDDRANGVSYRTGTVRDITERKLAEEALRESFLLARVLNQTNEMLLSSSDPADVFPEVLREASAVLEADYAVVSLKADADWRIAYGFESPLTPGSIVPAARAKGAEAIARSGQIFVSEDALSDERLDADYIGELGVRAFMHVPLSVRHRIIGILSFHNTHAPRRYTDSQKWFAGHLGSSVSLALENARAFQAEVEGKRLAQALSRIEQSIHSTLDRDEMLQRVADESSEVIGADGTTLALREDDSWVIRYGYGASARLIGMAFGPEEAPFITTAMDTGRPVAIDDAWSDPRARADRNRELGIRAVMMTPLIVRDEVLGGLFFNYRDAHHFTHQEVQYASRLGISLGLAVANVGLYEAQREVADLLQAALLSLPAELPGVEFSHAYHSATETARVGGDFYDVFELSHDHLGLVVGDVAGKGLDAAVLTSLVKNTVRAHASERGKTPAQVLSLTNDVVYKGTPTEAFVTVFFGMLDLRDGRLVYANAGHTTAALASKHAVVKLPVTGPILGAFPDLQYEQAEASIDLGELLFLYTDGLTEARNGTHLFGEERLFDLIAEHCEKCTRDLVDHVIGEVVTYAGNRLRDDLAMLALRRVDDGLRTPTQQKLEL
jgi:PAS domain S-box-containing protein